MVTARGLIGSPNERFVHRSVHAPYLNLHWAGTRPSPPAWSP
jgi:hypothetical protein